MKIRPPRWRSLKTRVTVMALSVFVASIWALALYAMHILRADLQQLTGKQLASTVNIVADQMNQGFVERLRALETVAGSLTTTDMAKPEAIQRVLEQQPLLQSLFNAGTFATDRNGVALASLPASVKRVGVSYADRDHISAALLHGRTTVSQAVIGKALGVPVVSMAAPIRSSDGSVIGVMVGVTNLSERNFLDLSIGHHYGVAGGYFLIDPRGRIIVTATDKRYNLKPLQSISANALFDRFTEGFEGGDVFVDAQGVEQIAAADRMETPGWYLAASLPTDEAFGPIRSMEKRLLVLACVLTLVAGLLAWWMLTRELSPVVATARKLARLSQSDTFPTALPVIRQDEVGDLINGFNRLLEVLQLREREMAESEDRFRALVNWLPTAMVVHDGQKILFANPAAERMLDSSSGMDLVGHSVLELVHPTSRARAAENAKRVLQFGGTVGIVKEIQMFNTIIHTAEKKIVIVPNAKITGDKIVVCNKLK